MICRNEIYNFENYTFKNYVQLTDLEKLMILDWRNHFNNRKWMFNQSLIKLDDHLRFIESLENVSDRMYWLVQKDGEPIGGLNLIHIQNNEIAEIGYFLDPNKQGGGLGLDFVFKSIKFAFEVLGIKLLQGNVMDKNKAAYLLNSFLGFKYIKEYTEEIDKSSFKFHYCELKKEDFYNNIVTKNDIEQFVKFYKQK